MTEFIQFQYRCGALVILFATAVPSCLKAAPLTAVTFATAHDKQRAQRCLSEAIYYEAAYEPEAGQEAVAEVVLNRLRHPNYPKSVCAVVYQGSERRTGCQFTFTCDGALRRRPDAALLQAAERVAGRALAGGLWPNVGNATHYHANYVIPYWSSSLTRIGQIGAHIFYASSGKLASGVVSAETQIFNKVRRSTAHQYAPVASTTSSTFSSWGLPIAVITSARNGIIITSGE